MIQSTYLKGYKTQEVIILAKTNADLLITLAAHENDENNVTIAFTMGLKAIEKGHKVEIMLLSNGVHIAEKGYADQIDIGAPFSPIKDILPQYIENGRSEERRVGKEYKSRMESAEDGIRDRNVTGVQTCALPI